MGRQRGAPAPRGGRSGRWRRWVGRGRGQVGRSAVPAGRPLARLGRRGPPLALAVVVALAGLAAGCVPSAGEVRTSAAASGQGPLAASGIRVLAQPPDPGAAPERLLRQFLIACADPDDDFAVAREYLAPDDRDRWDPRARVRLYDGEPGDLTVSRQGDVLTATAPATTATISAGDYSVVSGGQSSGLTTRVVRVKGQWRFTGMPDGLLLSSSLLFAFKPVDVYFLVPRAARVVPDRVFLLTARADLPAAAMRALVQGPSPMLAGAVRSAIPAGTSVSTSLRGGELSVDLHTRQAPVDRASVAAQVLWTATQLPEVSGVRLRIGSRTYTSGSVSVLRADPDALAFNPNVVAPTAPAFYVAPRGGSRSELVSTDGRRWALRPAGRQASGLRHPAVAADSSAVVALACPGQRCRALYRGTPGEGLARAPVAVSGSLTAPTWDTVGTPGAWTVDTATNGPPRVWRVPLRGSPVRVEAGALGPDTVRVLRLSRDGTRVAVIAEHGARRTVRVGVVVRTGGALRVERFRVAAPSLGAAVDLDWADAGHLAVLASSDAAQNSVTPYRVRVDGSEEPQPVLGTVPGGQPVAIAAAPAQSLLVATARQRGSAETGVSILQGQVWRQLAPIGLDPTYPG